MTVCCPTCGSNVERIDPAKAVAASNLASSEHKLVYEMLTAFGEYVPHERLIAALYSSRIDGGPDNAGIVARMISKRANKKLAAVGLIIETVGRGNGSFGRRLTWATEKARVA